MKSILIKIGKAWNIFKADGFWRGIKRLFGYFFRLFRAVGSGDILFITSGLGDSARYRCHHVCEELRLHGFKCAVAIQDNPWLPGYADKFKIFIFHRALATEKLKKLVGKIKAQRKEIIFETDDLLYDPAYFSQVDYFKNINALEKELYKGGLGSEIVNDPYVKVCTTTTSFLAQKLGEKGKKVFVVPNKLSLSDLKIIDKIKSKLENTQRDSVTLAYFSGTPSHDKDFAVITEVLIEIMKRHPQVMLLIFGPLKLDERFDVFHDRIECFPYVSRAKHFQNIFRADINLAPLEIGNPFCEAKSELKFFEAGVLGVLTVASATQTFKEAIADGVDGFLASTTEEWIEKLEKLIASDELRQQFGEKAREKSLENYTTKNSRNNEYYAYLKQKINQTT